MTRRAFPDRRLAFTLLEMMVVVVIAGVICVVALPRFGSAVAAAELRSAKQEVAASLTRARAAGVHAGAQTMFVRNGDVLQISVDSSGVQAMLAGANNLFTGHGVHVSSASTGAVDTIRYDARGFAIGQAGMQTLILTRGSLRDSVCITQLGKVAASGCAL
ncbi:MAG: hypothetical protein NVS1B4_19000 [Gemmatimonadaceae bacterium]